MAQLSHPYMTTGKTIALTIQTFVSKVMSLIFNTLFRFVIVFLPRSKHLLISWLQSPSTMILGPKEIKSPTVSIVPQLFAVKWWDWMPWSSFSECWVLSQLFHSPLSPSSKGSLVPLRFLPQGWCHPHTPRGSWQPNGRQRGLSRPFRMEEALPGFCEEIHYVSLLH